MVILLQNSSLKLKVMCLSTRIQTQTTTFFFVWVHFPCTTLHTFMVSILNFPLTVENCVVKNEKKALKAYYYDALWFCVCFYL
jgi:hypothetical protein